MSTYPIHTKTLTRSTTRPVTRLAVGAAVHGSVPGQLPVISIVGGGALLPGVTMVSDTSAPWLADGVQIAPASLSLELPWTVAPGAVITQPGSNALTVAELDTDAADWILRTQIADDESMEQPIQWFRNRFIRRLKSDAAPIEPTNWDACLGGHLGVFSGARTYAGAIVPIHNSMPTTTLTGFVSGDFHRVLGFDAGTGKYMEVAIADTDIPTGNCSLISAGEIPPNGSERRVSVASGNTEILNPSDEASGSRLRMRHSTLFTSSRGDGNVLVATTKDVSGSEVYWGNTMSVSAIATGAPTSTVPARYFVASNGSNVMTEGNQYACGVTRAVNSAAMVAAIEEYQSAVAEFLS